MLDLKEEQKYARLRKLGKELHIPIPEAFLTLEVFDKDGKLIQRHKQRSHSWTRNAYNHLFSSLAAKDADDNTFGAGKLNIKDTAGTLRYAARAIQLYSSATSAEMVGRNYLGAAGSNINGIQVGSGVNAESFEDYALQTLIANGTDPDELVYVESEPHSVSYSDTTLTNELVRYFNNDSGGSIDVNEVGLVEFGTASTLYVKWMQSRDKLASTVTVPDTGQLKVTYTIQLTYPA